MLIPSTKVGPRSLETELSTVVCCHTDTMFPAICDRRSWIVQSVFDCRLSDMIKERILC